MTTLISYVGMTDRRAVSSPDESGPLLRIAEACQATRLWLIWDFSEDGHSQEARRRAEEYCAALTARTPRYLGAVEIECVPMNPALAFQAAAGHVDHLVRTVGFEGRNAALNMSSGTPAMIFGMGVAAARYRVPAYVASRWKAERVDMGWLRLPVG